MKTGTLGTVKWTFDNETLVFEPVDGKEGICNKPLLYVIGELSKITKKVKTKGILHFIGESLMGAFSWFFNLETADLSGFETSQATDMSSMFNRCTALEQVTLSSFDTSSVTDMSCMFSGCTSLCNLDLSNFDTSKAKTMQGMFYGCFSLTDLDLSNFDTSKVKDMQNMFAGCSLLTNLDLSNFRTDNVRAFNDMFYKCFNLRELDISNFCFNKFPYVFGMFSSAGLSVLNMENIKSDVDFCLTRLPKFSCHYIVPKEIEEVAKQITTPSILAFIDLNYEDCGFNKPFIKKVLTALDTVTQLDFKNDLVVIKKTRKRDYTLALYKALELAQIDGHLDNDLIGVSAILKSYDVTIEKLKCLDQKQVIDLFNKTGITSDINAFLGGVPLEDILA